MRTPVLLAVLFVAACASSEGGGTGSPDSSVTPGVDSGGTADSDPAPIDSSDDPIDATNDPDSATTIDGSIDAPAIDAAIDAMPIDASIDAMPIDASTCPTTPCDLHQQCGCGVGQACDIDFSDLMGTACRGVATSGDENDTCTAINQCGAGWVCVGDGTSNQCEEYCDADSDCSSPRGQCVIQLTGTGGAAIPGAVVCSSNCNPATATNPLCPTNWTCDLFTANFGGTDREIADCRPVGARQLDQTCGTGVGECAAGLSCTNTGASNVCLKICSRPAGTECAPISGSTCVGFTNPHIVGGQEYGVCF